MLAHRALHTTPGQRVQKVVVINGTGEVLDLLESVLAAGRYDMVFVESSDSAYSQIKRVQPDLVILCVRIDDLDGFQLLSMLKLDTATASIPVLTYTTEQEGQDLDADLIAEAEEESAALLPKQPPLRMN